MPKRRGFTLLELLLATVLTTVLMIGVLSVVVRVSEPLQTSGPSDFTPTSREASGWLAVIREDLDRATEIQSTADDGFVCLGYAGIDRSDYGWAQRPVRVHYAVRSVEGERWLVREELALDEDVDATVHADLIASGVIRIELVKDDDAMSATSDAEADNASPAEMLWRLRIWTQERERPVLDRLLILRRGLSA